MLLSRFDKTAGWMRRGGRENDVVLSCRVRLARNFRRFEFPHKASVQDLLRVRQSVLSALEETSDQVASPLLVLPLEEFTPWERQSLIDRHLTSREHLRCEVARALAATTDASLAVLINEEDHLRLQSLLPGLQFDAAFELVNRLDDALEERFDQRTSFAFDPEFGFLTACPTNAGTGLRASAMLHLPALELSGRLASVTEWAQERGYTLRGTFGEWSRVWGHLHQLSNQSTLGLSESEIIIEAETITRELIEQERTARAALESDLALETRDRIGRALGVLTYSHTLSCQEAAECLSWVRLGHELDWLSGLTRQRFNELGVWIRPAYLQTLHGRVITGAERDALRAQMLRPFAAKIHLEPAFLGSSS